MEIGTQKVNIYRISGTDKFPPFTIIDTPGFCSEEGITKDLKIIELLLQKIKLINYINAICFVIKSCTNRFTINESYLFESINNLFGKDTKKNFIFMTTFSNEKVSPAIDYIIPNDPLINSVYPNWYYDFNYNLSSHLSQKNDDLYKKFWSSGMKNFETFIKELKKMKPVSKSATEKVLNQRNVLINVDLENLNFKKLIESKYILLEYGLKKEALNEISRQKIKTIEKFEKFNELIMNLFNIPKYNY